MLAATLYDYSLIINYKMTTTTMALPILQDCYEKKHFINFVVLYKSIMKDSMNH